jgi:hypothetical protein
MPQPIMAAPLTGCVTIDSKSPDGYLDNARAGNPTARANSDTEAVVENWLATQAMRPTWMTASLVGHGAPGLIGTGDAQSQSINLANRATWTPLLQRLQGKFTSLYLYGPSVGAGEDGAWLLFAIAQAANTAVYGPTGLIYCTSQGDFFLQSGSVWQMATPNGVPAPIEPPQILESPTEGGSSGPGVQAGQAPDVAAAQTQVQTSWDQPPQAPREPGDKITGA